MVRRQRLAQARSRSLLTNENGTDTYTYAYRCGNGTGAAELGRNWVQRCLGRSTWQITAVTVPAVDTGHPTPNLFCERFAGWCFIRHDNESVERYADGARHGHNHDHRDKQRRIGYIYLQPTHVQTAAGFRCYQFVTYGCPNLSIPQG